MEKKKISWVIPIFNESENIPKLIATLDVLAEKLSAAYNTEFVFVDDGSHDNSLEQLKKLYEERKNIKVLSFSRNFGHQMAITAGLDAAEGDAYIFMDADLQDPPEVCYELIQKWEEGYDVVYAKRRSRKDSYIKKLTAFWFYRILNQFSDVVIPEDTGDFRLISQQVAQTLRGFRERHRFIRGIISYLGFKQIAVMFDRHERTAGKTGYSIKKMIKLAVDGLTGFSLSPIEMIGNTGIFFITFGLLGSLVAHVLGHWVWALALVGMFFTGTILIALSVIGQFVGRTYQEAQGRPLYIVKEKLVR